MRNGEMNGLGWANQSVVSLYDEGQRLAEIHKWIESEKRGCDLGGNATAEWWDRHWPRFCRQKRLEHLGGRCRCREFEVDSFGRFYDLIVSGDLLLNMILDRVAEGWENLHFVQWVHEWNLPCERVIDLLELVDINRTRLEPPKR